MSTTKQQEMTETERIGLDDAGEVTLPVVDVLTGRSFICGKSGAGKSNSASVVVEELLDRGFPVMVVDTDGEYWGLKEQYEILHVGADEECDLQVGPEHAGKLADLALEQNVPIILDVSGYLDTDDADDLIRRTAKALFDKEKALNKPFLLLVEEVHEYIPEGGGQNDTGEMLVRVAKRGRKRGLGICGISQRPANVSKDYITQCDWLVWHRLTWDNDTDVVRRVIDREHADMVQELADGEAFVMADFFEDDVLRVQVRRKRTFDAGATPDLGEFERPELKSISGDLVAELEEISQEQQRRQDRIAELERELERSEDTIADLRAELERARDLSDMAREFTEAMATSGGSGEAIQQKVDEIREEKNERIRELESQVEELREDRDEAQGTAQNLRERVEELKEYEQAVEHMDELREAVVRMNEALGLDVNGENEKIRQKIQRKDDRIEELNETINRLQSNRGPALEPLEDYTEFLEAKPVKKEIEEAKQSSSTSERYVKGILAAIIAEGGPVRYDDIADRLGLSTNTHVSKAATELESRRIITKDGRSDGTYVDLNIDGINEVREAAARRKQTEELMEGL